ncbi:MAG: VWA domain-containing protein [Propionibacteriaceae bacterium]|nr:VWA domain-containing protein [Propionibacteriaceae bacterium]
MTAIPIGPFEFFAPLRLWALLALPLLIALYILGLHFSHRNGIRYTNTGVLAAVLPKQRQWRRHVAVAMALCSLVLIAGAWARPAGIEKVPRERATIVVVLDGSRSMASTDVSPTRFEAAKAAATAFVNQLPSQYNVAVVELTGNPTVMTPPTTDRATADAAIKAMSLADGTAIGGAIDAAMTAIAEAPASSDGSAAPALIVLLSDGTNTAGSDPMTAAQTAASKKVPIYTIAFGTQNGYVDLDGKRYNVAPDTALLQQIAQATGGQAQTAASASQLNKVYTQLKTSMGYEDVNKEVTARWALYALAFAVVAALGAVSMAARWP